MAITNTTIPSSSHPAPAARPVLFKFTSNANVAQVDTITLTGTSGTANIAITAYGQTESTNYLVTFNTSLTQTATDFDTTHSAALTALGITVTSSGADIILTAATAGQPFTSGNAINATGNLAGTRAATTANVTLQHLIARPVIDSVNQPPRVLDISPDSDFQLDVSSLLQNRFNTKARTNNYILPTLPATSTVTDNSAGALCNYYVDMYEVTGVTQPYIETYPATPQLTTSTRYAVNSTRQHTDTQTLGSYVATNSSSKFLTNQPSTKYVGLTETSFLSIYGNQSITYGIRIAVTDNAGVTTTSTLTSAAILAEKVILLAVGPDNINRRTASTITANTASYTITLINTTGPVVLSESKTFKLDFQSYPYTKTFHWINAFGQIDSYSFHYNFIKKQNASFKTYQSFLPYSFNVNDRGNNIMDISASESFEVSSDFISQAEATWLSEIKKSPAVWLHDTDSNTYIPVMVKAGESVVEDGNVLPQVKLEYAYANPLNTQRG